MEKIKSNAKPTAAPDQWEKALVEDFVLERYLAGDLRAANQFSINKLELNQKFLDFVNKRDSQSTTNFWQKIRNTDNGVFKIDGCLQRTKFLSKSNQRIFFFDESKLLACLRDRRNKLDQIEVQKFAAQTKKNSENEASGNEQESKINYLNYLKTYCAKEGIVNNIDDIERLQNIDTKYLNIYFSLINEAKEYEVQIETEQALYIELQKIFIRRNGLIEIKTLDAAEKAPLKTYALTLSTADKLDYLSIVFKLKENVYVEKHEFLHKFVPAMGVISKHNLPMDKKLKHKIDLDTYKPSYGLANEILQWYATEKQAVGVNQHITFNEVPMNVRDYLINEEPRYTFENIFDVMSALLQIEDIHILQMYKQFILRNITLPSNTPLSVEIVGENAALVENTLTIYDEVVLLPEQPDYTYDEEEILWLRVYRAHWKLKNGQHIYFGTVTDIYRNVIKFECKSRLPERTRYTVMFRPMRLLMRYQYRALELLRQMDTAIKCRMLFPEPPEYSAEYKIGLHDFKMHYENPDIAKNPEQLAAVQQIARSALLPAPYILFGPPGTGKTATIVEAICQIAFNRTNARILVMAQSNTACDEIAVRLLAICKRHNKDDSLVRIYSRAQVLEKDKINKELLEYSNMFFEHFYPDVELLHEHTIVVCTLGVAHKLSMGGFGKCSTSGAPLITHIFVDEAGAATEAEVLMGIAPMLSSKVNLILSGDHKQLGPILQSQTAHQLGLGATMMERLLQRNCYAVDATTSNYNRQIQGRLRRNYRSHKRIVSVFNELYYNNEIIAMATHDDCNLAANWLHLRKKDLPILFHFEFGTATRKDQETSYCNYNEINTVLDYVKDFMYFGIAGRAIKEQDIGIVTPYKKQYTILRERLRERNWLNIDCGSAELYQGKEKEIMIVSFVRSQSGATERSLGFVKDPRRLNVMLSRAKSLLILIGNPKTLRQNVDLSYVINVCKSSYRHTKRTPNEQECNSNAIAKDFAKKLTISAVVPEPTNEEFDHDALLQNLLKIDKLLKIDNASTPDPMATKQASPKTTLRANEREHEVNTKQARTSNTCDILKSPNYIERTTQGLPQRITAFENRHAAASSIYPSAREKETDRSYARSYQHTRSSMIDEYRAVPVYSSYQPAATVDRDSYRNSKTSKSRKKDSSCVLL